VCVNTTVFFRLVELLRSKLSKTNEDLDTIDSIEAAIGKVQKTLHDLQSEVPAFYVWGENPDTTEALLKVFIYYTVGHYFTHLLTTDLQQFISVIVHIKST
jgi:hypothetical protein